MVRKPVLPHAQWHCGFYDEYYGAKKGGKNSIFLVGEEDAIADQG